MININDISTGFINLVRSEFGIENKETELKAIKRLKVCNGCEFRSSKPKKISRFTTCTECGCVIGLKSRSDDDCPKNKWEKDDNTGKL